MNHSDFDKRFNEIQSNFERNAKRGIAVGVIFALVYWTLILAILILGVVFLIHHV